jgi:hypothetical protein
MNTAEYLDHLLLKYSGTFDIYQPYVIGGKEYPAYGYYFSHVEKYVLVKKANMWSTHSYEHILFIETESVYDGLLEEASELIKNYFEPVLVRKGEELPEENHMSSHINIVIISEKALTKEHVRFIKRFRFEKGYNFNMRGFSRGNILCVTLDDEKYICNRYAKDKKKLFLQIFEDIRAGRPGFKEICEKTGSTPFKQGDMDEGVLIKSRRPGITK